MTSVKMKFQPLAPGSNEGVVVYHLTYYSTKASFRTGYCISTSEWDFRRDVVLLGHDSLRNGYLGSLRNRIKLDLLRFTRILSRLDSSLEVTAGDIICEYARIMRECSIVRFTNYLIGRLRQRGKVRTAETYQTALNSFRRFITASDSLRGNPGCSCDDMMIDSLTAEIVESYEAYLSQSGVVPNTVSFYMRILRAVYNRAVDGELVAQTYPFRSVYTGIDKTVKRALPLAVIRKIRELDLTPYPALDYARDMFLLSFYMRGMSFVDMAFLRKSDLKSGCVAYRRRKTGQLLSVRWTREMRLIVGKYPSNRTAYLLPIITNPDISERSAYRNRAYAINYGLKKVAAMVGVDIPLTLYCARHSWASVARNKGIPVSVISEGMGHDSESTTRIYLASLDSSVVDRANALILRSL